MLFLLTRAKRQVCVFHTEFDLGIDQIHSFANCGLYLSTRSELPIHANRRFLVLVEETQAESSGDVQAVMEATGKSERTAEYLTTDTRKQSKAEQDAERDAEIARILQQNPEISIRQITYQLKASGHKRTDRKYIKHVVDKNRRGKIATDNYNVNCRLRKIRSSETVPSRVETEFPPRWTTYKVIASLLADKRTYSASDLAECIPSLDKFTANEILGDWYENVCLSPGPGDSDWMSDSDFQKWIQQQFRPLFSEGIVRPDTLLTCSPVSHDIQTLYSDRYTAISEVVKGGIP